MPRSKSSGTSRICAPCATSELATCAATAGSLLASPSIVLILQPLMPPCALISSNAIFAPRVPATSKKADAPLSAFAIPTVIEPFLQASDRPPWTLDPLLEALEPLELPVLPEAPLALELLLPPHALNARGAAATQRSATSLVWVPLNWRNFLSFHDARMCPLRVHLERNR
jgi:hypothetical protein